MAADENQTPRIDAVDLARKLKSYHKPSVARGVFEIAVTVAPFALVWAAMAFGLIVGQVWLYLVLLVPASLLLVRLFMIQHDCGHGSFFSSRFANDWVGRVIGVLTLTPYDHWKRGHAVHHATAGNLDHRGMGDVDTLTVAEYRARSRWGRLRYWLYRHPAVMFGLGPSYLFFVQSRLPLGFMRKGWRPWISTMATNAAIAVIAALMIWTIGLAPFLLVHVPVVLGAAAVGVWLFYVQHQFEHTHWRPDEDWSLHEAALEGSSHYDLPGVLRWFTANIGVHHVHHLSSRIPCYRLPEVLRDFPELRAVGRLTLLQSLRCVPLVLWDENVRRLISFKEFRREHAVTA